MGRFDSFGADVATGRYRRIHALATPSGKGPLTEAKAIVPRGQHGLFLMPQTGLLPESVG